MLKSTLALSTLLAAGVAVPAYGQRAERSPSTYASLEQLPDWSGWWGHDVAAPDELRRSPPPIKPEILAAARDTGPNPDADPLRYCRPLQFTGSSGGFTEAIELLFTPGRVTLTNERGLIRRIYADGRAMPSNPSPSNTGTSIGHWEGQTLVVETTGIDPRALYPGALGAPIGNDADITERIYLTDRDTLQFDIVTVAPNVLREPERRTRIYKRLPKTMANEITFCSDNDRSIDPGSGRQRFDLTPPPDLPAPPR